MTFFVLIFIVFDVVKELNIISNLLSLEQIDQ
jgi:hypothetical protein